MTDIIKPETLIPRAGHPGNPSAQKTGAPVSQILEQLGDGLICFDSNDRCTDVNTNGEIILGERLNDLLGRGSQKLFPQIDLRCNASSEKQVRIFEHHAPALDAWYQCVCYCVPNGKCIYLRNTTTSKHIEAQLRAAQERSALAQRAGQVGVFDWNPNSGEVVWTPELEELYGLEPGTFEGTYEAWSRRLLPEDERRIRRAIEDGMREGQRELAYEYQYHRPDGEVRWMATRAHLFYEEGRPVRMVGTCRTLGRDPGGSVRERTGTRF